MDDHDAGSNMVKIRQDAMKDGGKVTAKKTRLAPHRVKIDTTVADVASNLNQTSIGESTAEIIDDKKSSVDQGENSNKISEKSPNAAGSTAKSNGDSKSSADQGENSVNISENLQNTSSDN